MQPENYWCTDDRNEPSRLEFRQALKRVASARAPSRRTRAGSVSISTSFSSDHRSCDILLYLTKLLKTLPVARLHREFAGRALRSRVQREDGDEYLFDLHTVVVMPDGSVDEELAQVVSSTYSIEISQSTSFPPAMRDSNFRFEKNLKTDFGEVGHRCPCLT